jgi:hypothetical protein
MKRARVTGQVKKGTHLYRKNGGSTMAEVLVGFAFLMILMVGFVRLLRVSSDFLMAATDTASWQEELQEELYKKTPDESVVDVQTGKDVPLTFVQTEGADGNTVKKDGIHLTLEQGRLKSTTHHELNMTVYQILYMEETGAKESEEP